MKNVEIYSTDTCPYCVKAKHLLDRKNIKYQEINVTGDDEARMNLVKKANGLRTVPQIFIDDQHIGGCDDLYKLEQEGKLDQLLA